MKRTTRATSFDCMPPEKYDSVGTKKNSHLLRLQCPILFFTKSTAFKERDIFKT